MIATLLQVACCAALAGAAIFWIAKRKPSTGAWRFLLPYAIAASVAGVIVAYATWMELFVLWYSGAKHEVDGQPPFGLTIEQYAVAHSVFVLIPALSMIPSVGRRAFVVTFLSLLAVIPATIGWLFPWGGC